ncbi:MAG TPA: type 1 glutamine amidotransferase [Myxococcota bacterium]|nr:type 1 glutamine amidotransferase [Myxococcota bacterium]
MKVRLLQAREPGDVVRDEERQAFAARLGIPLADVLPHDLLLGRASRAAITDGVDAVVVGGSGAFSVYDPHPWVGAFIDLLGELAASGTPMFASCFGFQGLVVAAGGRVERDEARAEVGTFEVELSPAASDDPLFGPLPPRFAAQLGHKDHATVWPDSLTLLARSARCPYQALRVGAVWGTQFHPELTRDTNLLRFARYREAYAKVFGEDGYRRMVDGFRDSPVNDGLLARWAALVTARG